MRAVLSGVKECSWTVYQTELGHAAKMQAFLFQRRAFIFGSTRLCCSRWTKTKPLSRNRFNQKQDAVGSNAKRTTFWARGHRTQRATCSLGIIYMKWHSQCHKTCAQPYNVLLHCRMYGRCRCGKILSTGAIRLKALQRTAVMSSIIQCEDVNHMHPSR